MKRLFYLWSKGFGNKEVKKDREIENKRERLTQRERERKIEKEIESLKV